MGRYTGPKTKVSRRYGVPIFGSSKALERKNYPPGMHGPKGSRRKQSEYAIALGEKQKLRYQYGLLERQFRRIFQHALRKRGVTGETLLQLLETRLDNVIFRLGFANTRNAARQLVSQWGNKYRYRVPFACRRLETVEGSVVAWQGSLHYWCRFIRKFFSPALRRKHSTLGSLRAVRSSNRVEHSRVCDTNCRVAS